MWTDFFNDGQTGQNEEVKTNYFVVPLMHDEIDIDTIELALGHREEPVELTEQQRDRGGIWVGKVN